MTPSNVIFKRQITKTDGDMEMKVDILIHNMCPTRIVAATSTSY